MIWVVQMAAAFYFCVQKQGFHEDEYYTYYSTARTNGFYVEDGQWMERDQQIHFIFPRQIRVTHRILNMPSQIPFHLLPDVCIPPEQICFCSAEDFLRELLLHRGDCSFCTTCRLKYRFTFV